MDGAIRVDSKQGAGSRFSFEIRLPPASPPELPNAVSLRGVRVLLLDTNLRHRRVFDRTLRHFGAEVGLVVDHNDLIEILDSAAANGHPYQLLVLEQQADEFDGVALGRDIRARSRFDDLRMLIVYPVGNKGDAQLIAGAGFDAFLSRLCRMELLRLIIAAALQRNKGDPIVTLHSVEDALGRQSRVQAVQFQAQVLLVDDVKLNLVVASKLLHKLGVTVDVANDGREAVEKFRQKRYDLIFMDCMMPVMDGYEATRQIRELESAAGKRRIPIIALTANATREDLESCKAAGMDEVVTKPIRMQELSDGMRLWLGRPAT